MNSRHKEIKEKPDESRFQEISALKQDMFKITVLFQSPLNRKIGSRICDLASNFSFADFCGAIQKNMLIKKVWSFCVGVY